MAITLLPLRCNLGSFVLSSINKFAWQWCKEETIFNTQVLLCSCQTLPLKTCFDSTCSELKFHINIRYNKFHWTVPLQCLPKWCKDLPHAPFYKPVLASHTNTLKKKHTSSFELRKWVASGISFNFDINQASFPHKFRLPHQAVPRGYFHQNKPTHRFVIGINFTPMDLGRHTLGHTVSITLGY